ncbi:GNAT family N-acetyltransferase [Saccharothrix australiensis]|uniref:RimJ/RimL family protein N-acetyltransferase n=1 Tax=Saccharothrix australiensis TaxID=2072 RepID=A0A495W045_9PSEU|nr:GNAT family N-acetyltransferase [Saccharothrix australiensis]RKT55062.1 RimJ/RimL family protein N-acetyltransferase [Saccharothrix australiensis]
MIALRPLDDAGLERLLALAVSDADPSDVMPPGWTPDRPDEFRAFYRGLAGDAFEIVDGDRVVGMTRLTPAGETGLWVARSARGAGVATQAVSRVVEQALWRGLSTVTAETTAGNAPALAVLRRLGAVFETDGDRVRARIEVPAEPSTEHADPARLVHEYLDFYRDKLLRKVAGLSDGELRASRVPSGWTPLTLVKHLAYVELRWFRYTFAGEDVEHPRGNPAVERAEWTVEEGDTIERVRAFYLEQCARAREIAAAADLADRVARWQHETVPPPTLAWVLFHMVQEYARHVGQLDVVRELTDGVTGP